MHMAAERPLVGWGPVNNKYELGIRLDERIHRRRDAHNLLLEVLTATGAFGAVPFLVGLGLCAAGAWQARRRAHGVLALALLAGVMLANMSGKDRKSTRLNSSHGYISYAVFCLKKKKSFDIRRRLHVSSRVLSKTLKSSPLPRMHPQETLKLLLKHKKQCVKHHAATRRWNVIDH